jgi:hypothetical protein
MTAPGDTTAKLVRGPPVRGQPVRGQPVRGLASGPYLLAALVVVAALVGLTLPSLVSYAPYGQQAIDQQIDAEDSSLCAKFGLRPEMNQFHECKTDLADMRHRHEQLLLY